MRQSQRQKAAKPVTEVQVCVTQLDLDISKKTSGKIPALCVVTEPGVCKETWGHLQLCLG